MKIRAVLMYGIFPLFWLEDDETEIVTPKDERDMLCPLCENGRLCVPTEMASP